MESGYEEYDKLIWPIMTACKMFGCWPKVSRGSEVLLHRGHRILTIILLFILSSAGTAEAATFWGEDMNDTIECSLISSALYMATLRVILFNSHQDDMLYVVETMRQDWARSSDEQRQLLRNKCLLTFKLAKFFIISVGMTSIFFAVGPIIEV